MTKFIKTSFLFFLLLYVGASFHSTAQTIVFAKSFTETGEGLNKRNIWYADSAESRIAIIFNNGRQTINSHKIYVEIKNAADSLTKLIFNVGSNKNWVADYYNLPEIGKYVVSARDDKGNILATTDVFLRGKEENSKTDDTYKMANAAETKRFSLSKIIFCEAFKEGRAQNEGTSFKIEGKGKYVEIILTSDKPLSTDKLMVDVWKKKNDDQSFNEHFDTKEFKTDKTKSTAVFHYSFRKPGDYKISIFNKEFVWINSGYVTITE